MPGEHSESEVPFLDDDTLGESRSSIFHLSNNESNGMGHTQNMKGKVQVFYNNYILKYSGFSLLILSQFFNSIMVVSCKLLVTDSTSEDPIHPLQILFVRMLVTYLCCLVYMLVLKNIEDAPLGPRSKRGYLLLRGAVGFVGVFGMYFSLQYISLSDAVAITFFVPIVTSFLAWVILHERYSLVEGACSILSFVGVFLIAKPSFIFGDKTSSDENVESSSTEKRLLASFVGLLGVFGASSVFICLRKIGKLVHPLITVSYFALFTCIVSMTSILVIPSIKFELPKNSYQALLFTIIGFSGFIMQYLLTAGVQRVPAGKSALMGYTSMVFAIIWDFLIWHHLPGFLSLLGIIVILSNAFVVIKHKNNNTSPGDDEDHEIGKTSDIPLDEFIIDDESD